MYNVVIVGNQKLFDLIYLQLAIIVSQLSYMKVLIIILRALIIIPTTKGHIGPHSQIPGLQYAGAGLG